MKQGQVVRKLRGAKSSWMKKGEKRAIVASLLKLSDEKASVLSHFLIHAAVTTRISYRYQAQLLLALLELSPVFGAPCSPEELLLLPALDGRYGVTAVSRLSDTSGGAFAAALLPCPGASCERFALKRVVSTMAGVGSTAKLLSPLLSTFDVGPTETARDQDDDGVG